MQLAVLILDKLVFIGGCKDGDDRSSSVDLVDRRTVRVSPLPDLSCARGGPGCAAIAFGDNWFYQPGAFTSEFYGSGAKR